MSLYKTTGIVLKKNNFSDHHGIAVIFTRDFGKVKGVARGIRKIRSKLAPHLEVGTLAEFMFAKGKKDLDTVATARAICVYKNLRMNLKKSSSLYYLCELVHHLTPDVHEDRAVFELLAGTLNFLDQKNGCEIAAVLAFKLKLLKLLGHLPEYYHCLKCGAEIKEEENYFSFAKGGLLCPACEREKTSQPLSALVLKVTRFFVRSSLTEISCLKISKDILRELENYLSAYSRYLFARDFNSARFLRQVC